jgi:hypothetical protein
MKDTFLLAHCFVIFTIVARFIDYKFLVGIFSFIKEDATVVWNVRVVKSSDVLWWRHVARIGWVGKASNLLM